jgi:hypothetical protein
MNLEVDMIRRSMLKFAAVVGLVLASTAVTARAEDQGDNPQYKMWAKFKPGSTATREMKTEMPSGSQTITMTSKLASIDDTKAVVSTEIDMMGRTIKGKDQEIQAKISEDKKLGEPAGEEDVKAGDKTYHCKVYTMHGPPPGSSDRAAAMMANSDTKVWISDEVPGGLVKMTSSTKNGETEIKVEMMLKSCEAK